MGVSVPGSAKKTISPLGVAPPLSLIITGFSNLRVAKSRHRRRRSGQTQGSQQALRLKPSSSFKSSVISPPISRSPGEKRPLLMPGRLKVPDNLRLFSSLSPTAQSPVVDGRLEPPVQTLVPSPVNSVAFDYRENAPFGLSGGAQTYRISRSLSSSSLPSLEDDWKCSLTTTTTLPLPFGSMSQSVQDFSECCRDLECFSLGEPSSIVHSMVKVRKQRGGRSCPPLGPPIEGLVSEDSPQASQSCSHGPMSHSSSCASEARQHQDYPDISVNDLAGYLEDSIIFPKKMSYMAEMMYT